MRPGLGSRLAGCAAPGYVLFVPADGVAAPESLTWGVCFRPGARSRLADCAAPEYDLFLPADGVVAPESLATMVFARDWVTSTLTHAMYPGSGPSCGGKTPTSCSSSFLLLDHEVWLQVVLLELFRGEAGLSY